jgi:hypothetical protein
MPDNGCTGFSLLDHIPALMPEAVAWAEEHSAIIARDGIRLSDAGIDLARRVGVALPKSIRILEVERIPSPTSPMLAAAVAAGGFLTTTTAGLTLGHSIYIRTGEGSVRLCSHEFRHVAQYEHFGSIRAFLNEYLVQVGAVGYHAAALEADARAHEVAG